MNRSESFLILAAALACAALALILAASAEAQTTINFSGFDGVNGYVPEASVTQATDGNFYGTTVEGGTYGLGNVFRLTSSGTLSSIYSFCSEANCTDGEYPYTAPILGADGNLYGVVFAGGSHAKYSEGAGTVYKLTLAGKLTTLYTFCPTAPCLDGVVPEGLIQASDGNFYGVTEVGGQYDSGVAFQLTPAGAYKVLHTFCSKGQRCPDGGVPFFPPIQGRDGNLYGAAQFLLIPF